MKKTIWMFLLLLLWGGSAFAMGTTQKIINVYPETLKVRDEACKKFGNPNGAFMPWNFKYQTDGAKTFNVGADGKQSSVNYSIDANGQKIPLQLCGLPTTDSSKICYDPNKPTYDPAQFNACSKSVLGY